MPNLFHRSIALLMLLATTALVPDAGALSGISNWAQEGVDAAEANGLVSESLKSLDAIGEITRAEFCSVAINAYKTVSGKAVFVSADKNNFRDCNDPNVTAAYELGLVKGGGSGYFYPDASIKRQDICVMLYNILGASNTEVPELAAGATLDDFPDVYNVSGYARQAVAAMVNCGVMNGVSTYGALSLDPEGFATREQALIISNRFCKMFAEEPEQVDNDVSGYENIESYFSDSYSGVNYDNIDISSYGGVSFGSTGINSYSNYSSMFDYGGVTEEEKRLLVYGGGDNYQSSEEAEAHMVEIAVNVWRLNSDGTKTTGIAYLTVNENLASVYEQIFDEIYNGNEKFPIKDVGCYSWRTGEHSQGTAVDINPDENMEATINSDGSLTPTCGTHWSPGTDPYSIPEGGDVYNAFTRHGFSWGGNAWQSKRDYMHFSYFGR